MNEKVPNLEFVRRHREAILALADTYGAYNVRVFGSVARGTAQTTSDIDFLVTFPPTYKLLHHAGLITALTALLGLEVDVSVEANLREVYRADILATAIAI
jgi:predicted nucleotidyltransferase